MTVELDLVLLACLVAAGTDLLWRKIPNAIPISIALIGLSFAAGHGFGSAVVSLGIILAVLVLGTLIFARGWLGGGDIKLLAAACGAMSLGDVPILLVSTSIGGGVIALGITLARGRLRDVLRSCRDLVRPLLQAGAVAIAPERPITMPYAVAIAFGVVTVALSHTFAPYLRLPI